MTNSNINVDTVQECNLLCKCIIDYIENTSVTYNNNSKNLNNLEGNFINFKDTNYEVSNVEFNYPSIITIDGERFDMEVIITHTNPSHIHYHLDIGGIDKENQHKHFHSHKGEDPEKKIHNIPKNPSTPIHHENVYLHILYNIGDHKNTRINNFFSQLYRRYKYKKQVYYYNLSSLCLIYQ